MKLRRLSTLAAGFDAELAALTRYQAAQDPEVEASVKAILQAVRSRGDAAVLEYARRFDKVSARSLAELEISAERTKSALACLPAERREALKTDPSGVIRSTGTSDKWTTCLCFAITPPA
jgi:histidinol dehydrogenase